MILWLNWHFKIHNNQKKTFQTRKKVLLFIFFYFYIINLEYRQLSRKTHGLKRTIYSMNTIARGTKGAFSLLIILDHESLNMRLMDRFKKRKMKKYRERMKKKRSTTSYQNAGRKSKLDVFLLSPPSPLCLENTHTFSLSRQANGRTSMILACNTWTTIYRHWSRNLHNDTCEQWKSLE